MIEKLNHDTPCYGQRFFSRLLDADKLAGIKPSTVRELVERCTACRSPEQCEWDLRQDAANPAWQAYCPNAATLMAFARLPSFQIRTTEKDDT